MTSRTEILRQLVERSLYVVDEQHVSEAMLLRARLRHTVPGVDLHAVDRGDARPRPEPVRSFRHDARAKSFRLARTRGPLHHSARDGWRASR